MAQGKILASAYNMERINICHSTSYFLQISSGGSSDEADGVILICKGRLRREESEYDESNHGEEEQLFIYDKRFPFAE